MRRRVAGSSVGRGEAPPARRRAPRLSDTYQRRSLGLPAPSSRRLLVWEGDELRLRKTGRQVAEIVPHAEWPGLYRIKLADGRLSDTVNKTRAKDAAVSLALAALGREVTAEAA